MTGKMRIPVLIYLILLAVTGQAQGADNKSENSAGVLGFDELSRYARLNHVPYLQDGSDQAQKLTTIRYSPDRTVEELNFDRVAELPPGPELASAMMSSEWPDPGRLMGHAFLNHPGSLIGILEIILPDDDRQQISDTSKPPYVQIGRMGNRCTGTLIGPRHVLTAAHCVYNIKSDSWLHNFSFSAAQNGMSHRPFGKVEWKYALTFKGWTQYKDINYDLALIVLASDIGSRTGWHKPVRAVEQLPVDVLIAGYPKDQAFATMWQSECRLNAYSGLLSHYDCDTKPGMSGAGLLSETPGPPVRVGAADNTKQHLIFGVHAYYDPKRKLNQGTRLTPEKLKLVQSWLAHH